MSSATLDQAGKIRDENVFDPAVILPFLREHIAGLDGAATLQQFAGGASNITYLLKVGEREMILRRPPAGTKAKSAHDMGREFRILQRLSPHFPCPRPLVFCQDESLIGSEFYVMEKIAGIILRKDLPAGIAYTPEQARRLCLNLLDTQIQLHTLDYERLGLADMGKPQGYVERQVRGWNERYIKARTDDVPMAQDIMAWLDAKQPADSPKPGIIHNDYRFDNVVLSPSDNLSIIGVLDWEMATLGDPLMDLGSSLAYWVQKSDSGLMQSLKMQPSTLPGMLTREEIVAYYGEKTGREINNLDFYYVFGLFRLAVIAQQIYYRWKHGQTNNPRFQAFGMFVKVLCDLSSQIIVKSKL